MPQNSHPEGDGVLPDLYLQASIATNKVWQSLLFGTQVFVAGHVNLVVTQAMKIDENNAWSHKGAQL